MTIATRLNNSQRERIARNVIGYDGPMSQFNNFLESDQSKKTLYNNVIAQIDQKMMARKGGMSKKLKMDNGGVAQKIEDLYQETFNRPATVAEQDFYQKEFGDEIDSDESDSLTKRLQESKGPDAPPDPTAPDKPKAEKVEDSYLDAVDKKKQEMEEQSDGG